MMLKYHPNDEVLIKLVKSMQRQRIIYVRGLRRIYEIISQRGHSFFTKWQHGYYLNKIEEIDRKIDLYRTAYIGTKFEGKF